MSPKKDSIDLLLNLYLRPISPRILYIENHSHLEFLASELAPLNLSPNFELDISSLRLHPYSHVLCSYDIREFCKVILKHLSPSSLKIIEDLNTLIQIVIHKIITRSYL